jgi:hypothetical protein
MMSKQFKGERFSVATFDNTWRLLYGGIDKKD